MMNRRDFLKAGGAAALGLGVAGFRPSNGGAGGAATRASLTAPLWAGSADEAKLLFIFQRGGNDGVNTVIPYGDPEYSTANRPTLFIPRAAAIDLGNEFAGLHPRMAPMMEIYNHPDIDGAAGPGNLAVIHRVGYAGQSQSHFDSQQYWETGVPDDTLEEGMFYREVATTIQPTGNRLPAAAISGSQMTAFKGPLPIPTLSDPAGFTFSGSPSQVRKFLGQLPASPGGPDGRGLLGVYGGPTDYPGKPYRDLVYGTGLALADAISIVQEAVAQGPYVPAETAIYPGGGFGEKLMDAAMLFKRTPARIIGLNIGGWDTHTNQGQVNGRQGDLLAQVAQGFQALYRDLAEQWDRLIVVTMTEFGRTSRENGSRGTDHGHACVMFVAGGHIRGGVYNCDSATWAPGDLFSARDRYVRRRTDYRAVFGEIFTKHFGNDEVTLEAVIPGYAEAALENPEDFKFLNLLL